MYFSVPELKSGETYTICVGSEEYSVALTGTAFSNTTGEMGGGQGGMGGGQRPQGEIGGGKRIPPQGGTGTDVTSSATVEQ